MGLGVGVGGAVVAIIMAMEVCNFSNGAVPRGKLAGHNFSSHGFGLAPFWVGFAGHFHHGHDDGGGVCNDVIYIITPLLSKNYTV